MVLTDEQYGIIISLCEWNNPDSTFLLAQSEITIRQNLLPTLNRMRTDAIQDGRASMQNIVEYMIDHYQNQYGRDETVFFANIEADVRVDYG